MPKIIKISSLEKRRRMGHPPEEFHSEQFKDKAYLKAIDTVAKLVLQQIKTIRSKKDINILEFGAGTGILSLKIIKKLINGRIKNVNFYITEPDSDLLKYSVDYIRSHVKNKKILQSMIKWKRIVFVQAKAEDIAKFRKKFDIIISTDAMHHIDYTQKINCIKKQLAALSETGVNIIGDNFVADKYRFKDKNGKIITDRKTLAPTIAKLLKTFWDSLFKGKEWPIDFKRAYEQQKKGVIECKTSLPHLVAMIEQANGHVIKTEFLNPRLNQEGGYAIIVYS